MSEAGFGRWRVTCQVSKLISVTGVFGDLVGIFGIALERFIYITFPLQYETLLTRGRVVAMLVASWTAAVCFSVFGVVFSDVEIRRGETCEVRNVYSQTQTTIGFIPCVVAVLIISGCSLRADWSDRLQGITWYQPRGNTGRANQPIRVDLTTKSTNRKRITSVLSLVIGVFVVTYIPVYDSALVGGETSGVLQHGVDPRCGYRRLEHQHVQQSHHLRLEEQGLQESLLYPPQAEVTTGSGANRIRKHMPLTIQQEITTTTVRVLPSS